MKHVGKTFQMRIQSGYLNFLFFVVFKNEEATNII